MIIDTLTLAGFVTAASYLLMPILMKKEFIRVESPDDLQAQPASPSKRERLGGDASLGVGSIPTA